MILLKNLKKFYKMVAQKTKNRYNRTTQTFSLNKMQILTKKNIEVTR